MPAVGSVQGDMLAHHDDAILFDDSGFAASNVHVECLTSGSGLLANVELPSKRELCTTHTSTEPLAKSQTVYRLSLRTGHMIITAYQAESSAGAPLKCSLEFGRAILPQIGDR